jgi:prepilin-type N-terminal cleavage/methylation domain-containing protein
MKLHSQRGVSLVEMIVALFIGGILLVLVTKFFASQNKTYLAQMDSADLRGGIRASMDLVQRELRNAGYDPMGIGFFKVKFDPYRLVILGDYNADGDIADTDEQLQYWLDQSTKTLRRGPYTPWGMSGTNVGDIVMENVDTFYIEYRNAAGSPVSSYADSGLVKQVRIRMRAGTTSRVGAVKSREGRQINVLDVIVAPRNWNLGS